MSSYFLVVESGLDAGQRIPLPVPAAEDQAPLVLALGRDASANLRFPDQTMSRRQAELRWEGGGWHLLNLSQHGSYIGRRQLKQGKQRRLRPGEVVTLGETQVRFVRADDAPPSEAIHDTFTPRAPAVASPPSLAGYDPDGQFHSGLTLYDVHPERETKRSYVYLLKDPSGAPRLAVKLRRLYFLTLLGLLGVIGLALLFHRVLLPSYRAAPERMLLATALAFLPALPYLLLFKFLDRNDQVPWKNVLACAVWGGTIGCGFSLLLNGMGQASVAAFVGTGEAYTTTAVLIAPLVEEVTKGLAVLVLFWFLHDEFDNLVEGLILGAASGLGFALVENCVYNLRFLEQGWESVWQLGGYRMVVNALIGHPIYTALTGAGLGLLRETPRKHQWRWLLPALGLVAAIGLHVSWNAAAIYLGGLLEEGSTLQLATNGVLLGGAGLSVFTAAYLFAAARERRVLVTYLVEEIEAGFVERRELDSFHEFLGRIRYELAGLRRGWLVYRLRKSLRRAQVELAFRKWHLAQGDTVRGAGGGHDLEARALRNRIRDLRNALNRVDPPPSLPPLPPGATTFVPPAQDEHALAAAPTPAAALAPTDEATARLPARAPTPDPEASLQGRSPTTPQLERPGEVRRFGADWADADTPDPDAETAALLREDGEGSAVDSNADDDGGVELDPAEDPDAETAAIRPEEGPGTPGAPAGGRAR
ncbi:MAG: PrsW family glutamic-type intramembrane protease [Planctomycetota bacterium]